MTTLGDSPTLGATLGATLQASTGGAARTGSERDPSGRQIGRFRVLDKLGEGGMGMVFAAHDDQLDRMVALKFLTKSGSSHERLEREARSLARLAHPNVVAVYEVGESEGMAYLAMEYVPGQTLGDWIGGEQPRSRLEILRMFAAVGRGLAAAHEVGVVHRDFKPDNVIVGHDGRPRVLDFGLARVGEPVAEVAPTPGSDEHPRDASLTATGAVMGTPAYMAPEQWSGIPADARTDQFAFCIALFEALYGRPPFGGTTSIERMAEVIDADPIEIAVSERVPATLHEALLRGLAKSPEDRWPAMAPLLEQIDQTIGRVQPGLFERRPVLVLGFAVMMVSTLLSPLVWFALELAGVIAYSARNWAYISGAQLSVLLILLLSQRRRIIPQVGDPRLLGGPVFIAMFILGHRAIAFTTGSSIEVMFAYDFLATVGFASLLTFLVERALWPIVIMNVGLTIAATLQPHWGPRLWLVFTLCLPVLVLLRSKPPRGGLREGATSRPPSTR